jgi:acetyl-CoA carboxylase biotin carboxylase subunit
MFKKVFIANRGEIALRIIRTLREMGIPSVLACSTVDASSLPARLADEKVCIGPPQAKESYLNIPALMSAVEMSKADAIHPGYGFLSENHNFAEICRNVNVKFIGPEPEVIELLGNKIKAREIAEKAGVPVVPGKFVEAEDDDELIIFGEQIGFPVVIKAAMGGGGRGMKIIRDMNDFKKYLEIARSEAKAAFGDGTVYLEKYFENARHIEVQLLADEHGNIVPLGERECSIQRRFQKIIEESPSPAVDEKIRSQLFESAIAIAKSVNYTNSGTVEFLLVDRKFYFLEVNTRLQVEHPVTECLTGIDIVKEQIRIAAGEKLAITEKKVKFNGSVFEARVNAEDPLKFTPSPGPVSLFIPPGGRGVRVDSAIYSGYEVPPFYDSLIAKIIVSGSDREEARKRMLRALRECVVEGINTNISLLLKIFSDEEFSRGEIHTRFLDKFIPEAK